MQKGVNTKVAIVIIVMIVIVLGGLFLLIGKKNIEENSLVTMKNNVVQDVLKKEDAKTIPVSEQKYIEVKELGFKIPVTVAIANDETYVVDQSQGAAYFSSKTLNAKAKDCGDGNSGAVITKIPGVLSKEWDVKHPDGGDLYNRFYGTEQFKQFDDFFLIYHSPMDSCSMGKYVDLESAAAKPIIDGFKGIVLMDNSKSAVNASDWKTYTNTAHGISFQYPMNANVDVEKFPNEEENTITIRNLGESELRLTVFPNSNSKSIQFSNVNDTWKDLVSGKSKTCSKVMIAGEYGYRCFSSEVSGSVSATVDYYFKKKDSLYMASMVVLGNRDEKKADEIIAMIR